MESTSRPCKYKLCRIGVSQMTLSEMITKSYEVAQKCSNCNSRKVGAIIQLADARGYAIGYNNTRSEHCEKDCYRKRIGIESGKGLELCEAIHAEVDAIERCANLGLITKGAHIHVTDQPCDDCAKRIVKAGIRTVTWCNDYPHSNSIAYFKEHGVNAFKVGGKNE